MEVFKGMGYCEIFILGCIVGIGFMVVFFVLGVVFLVGFV